MNLRFLMVGGIIVFALILIGSMRLAQTTKQKQANSPQPTNAQALFSSKNTELTTDTVMYFQDVQGYYVKPSKDGMYPGIVVVHEWWGLNDHIKSMADNLAKEGYQVLAVDLYNGTIAKTPDEARQYRSALDQEQALANMQAAVMYLKNNDAQRVGSLGWCFGGGQVMQLSVSGEPLNATVIYYGDLETDTNALTNIQWPVLGVFGDQDQSIPVETVKTFDAALDQLEVKNEIYIYPGVGHAFANPSGQNFAPDETKDAWQKTLQFLRATLKEN